MGSAHTKFSHLRTQPFGETPDLRFFFEAPTHVRALEVLQTALRRGKGFSLLLGEVGTGKTLVSRALMHGLGDSTDSALILNPQCTDQELVRAICRELDIPGQSLDDLNTFLLQNARKYRQTVVLIDEAQNLPLATLEAIRLLSNLETGHRKLIQIILVAQPEFASRLAQPALRQLRQRIGATVTLSPLTAVETDRYIRHRIERAGGGNFLRFNASASALIHTLSAGVPREINRLCETLILQYPSAGPRQIQVREVRETLGIPAKNWLARFLGRDRGRDAVR